MTITRDGKEYTLTNAELMRAFDEALRVRYESEVRFYLEGYGDDKLDEWAKTHEGEYEEFVLDIVDAVYYWYEQLGSIWDDERIDDLVYNELCNDGIIDGEED